MDDLQKKRQLTWPEFLLIKGRFALLEAIIAPQFLRTRGSYGPLTACKSNLKNIGTALDMYSTDWQGKYPPNLEFLTPDSLKTIPQCAIAGRQSYRTTFGPTAPGNIHQVEDYFIVECVGVDHESGPIPADYPKFNSTDGLIDEYGVTQ